MAPKKTDPDPDTQTDPAGGQDDGGGATMGDLRKMVAEVVETALKPIKDAQTTAAAPAAPSSSTAPAPTATGASELQAMVQAAVAEATGAAKQADAEEAHRKQHEVLAAAAEKPPVERPRRSWWLGNIWDK